MGLGWYLRYKGQYYDAGTKVKIKNQFGEIETTTFMGGGTYEPCVWYSSLTPPEYYIVEIIEPVYYQPPKPHVQKGLPAGDGPFYALLWYIAIMVVGIIFKDRWLVWIIATLCFFGYIKKK